MQRSGVRSPPAPPFNDSRLSNGTRRSAKTRAFSMGSALPLTSPRSQQYSNFEKLYRIIGAATTHSSDRTRHFCSAAQHEIVRRKQPHDIHWRRISSIQRSVSEANKSSPRTPPSPTSVQCFQRESAGIRVSRKIHSFSRSLCSVKRITAAPLP
jgi:hypothetical protein